ncbi:putative ribonuclease P protein subunit 3 [Podospora australis]|uniref:Ribonuclease P protein subunit 3 n=1 Tax=Podospora australis TaxID=1536484 RepID=A0AAN6WJF3_9PEZI|nr:putative ribonuclease P protein subunit 3 [Podospora australis]
MLYDLNIPWSPTTSPPDLESTLRLAKHFGYDVVALNHTITSGASIPNSPNPITNPIPVLSQPHPSYPGGSGSITSPSPVASSTAVPSPKGSLPITLRRVTITVADPSTTNYRLPDFSRAYDLVALRPTSDKSFQWACLSTTEPPSLISLDMTQSLGYHIHHRTAMAAVSRGSRFEICYSQVLDPKGQPDPARARSNFIGNVQSLIRATKGRGIVISSEAKSALGLRAPADMANLFNLWGLGSEKGFAAMGTGARSVVENEGIKRRGFRGVVDIVQPAEGGEDLIRKDKEAAEGKGKKQKQKQQQQQGQKRKGGANGGQGGQQAKKMRKETKP